MIVGEALVELGLLVLVEVAEDVQPRERRLVGEHSGFSASAGGVAAASRELLLHPSTGEMYST